MLYLVISNPGRIMHEILNHRQGKRKKQYSKSGYK